MLDILSEELRAIERDIDNYHLSNVLMRRPFAEGGWYFLAFCEEHAIRDIVQNNNDPLHQEVAKTDNLIVHSKAPLQWLTRACPINGVIPKKFDDSLYEAAWKLSELSMEYLAFESAFTYASLGLVKINIEGNRLKTIGQMRQDTKHDAYDRFMDIPRNQSNSLPDLTFLDRIAKSVSVKDDWFTYDLKPQIICAGLEARDPLLANMFVLPEDWKLPRFSLEEFRKVARVLWVLASIHFHARVTAAMHGCKGLGFARALIIMGKPEIINRLRRYSGVNEDAVISIVESLTYGSGGQSNPDLALQPIVSLNSSQVAIAPNIIMGNSLERNLTVLLNRLPEEKQAYAKLSQTRETQSRNQIMEKLSDLSLRFWYGQMPKWGKSSEIDLVIISDVEEQCLFLELKSFIGPAEAREIRDRSEEIRRGIEQTQNRMKMAKEYPGPLYKLLNITSNYKLDWVVASETSIGACYVQSPDIPIVNVAHLISFLSKKKQLTKCCEWLRTREYLPKEGIHYLAIETEAKIGDWILEWYGLRMLVDTYD